MRIELQELNAYPLPQERKVKRYLMNSLRVILWLLLFLSCVLTLGGVLTLKKLSENEIFISWQGAELQIGMLMFDRLDFNYQQSHLALHDVNLSWLTAREPLQELRIGRVKGYLDQGLIAGFSGQDSDQVSDINQWMVYLPKKIRLQQVEIDAPSLAKVSGAIAIEAENDLYHPRFLAVNLTAKKINTHLVAEIPKKFRPQQAKLSFQKVDEGQVESLENSTFLIDLAVQGNTSAALKGLLRLEAQSWHARLDDAVVSVNLPQWKDSERVVNQLALKLYPELEVSQDRLRLRLSKGSKVSAKSVKINSEISFTGVQADISQLQFTINNLSKAPLIIEVDSPINLQASSAKYSGVATQSWMADGHVSGELPQVKVQAKIKGAQGLAANINANYKSAGLSGYFDLDEVFFRGSNPIQQLLPKYWPEWVILTNGRLRMQGDFSWSEKRGVALKLDSRASGLTGEINRSVLNEVDFQLKGNFANDQLELNFPNLSIKELNPGIPVGPITVTQLKAVLAINKPDAVKLTWGKAVAGLLNGQILVGNSDLSFNRKSSLTAEVVGLDIQELLRIYPAEGLKGAGILDGYLPFSFDLKSDQFSINNGLIKARAPGYLKFDNANIKAMGETNQAMRIVTEALEDFHYDLLSGQVNYDETGKLLMNLRLEGRNPDLEKGRPIHFNINLEEDIPALLASLQLSGKVSDTIQQRVKERLEKRTRK